MTWFPRKQLWFAWKRWLNTGVLKNGDYRVLARKFGADTQWNWQKEKRDILRAPLTSIFRFILFYVRGLRVKMTALLRLKTIAP